MKKTKIIATLGPSSEKIEVICDLIKAGVNVFRLNFSHSDYNWHRKVIKRIRLAEKLTRRKIAIMADIQGPRIRIANQKKIKLIKGEKVFLTDLFHRVNYSFSKEIFLDWKGFFEWIKRGDWIYIEDGLIQLRTIKKMKGGIVAEVIEGGEVVNHKGVNIPAISHHLGFLTRKDQNDLSFVLTQDVDAIAVSFVSSPKNLVDLKRLISYFMERKNKTNSNIQVNNKFPWIISKIERREAILNIDGIISESDGIMIARGDLAIEAPQEKLAIFQKEIIKKCLKFKKPSIVATQIMASMVNNSRPTRAEISDLTNAVIDQTDAVMFSNETAMGKNPVKVVEIARKIIEETEKSSLNDLPLRKVGNLARKIFQLSKKPEKKRKLVIESLEDAKKIASLRSEKVEIKFKSKETREKRLVDFLWGIY